MEVVVLLGPLSFTEGEFVESAAIAAQTPRYRRGELRVRQIDSCGEYSSDLDSLTV
jgi:hypothetical protein